MLTVAAVLAAAAAALGMGRHHAAGVREVATAGLARADLHHAGARRPLRAPALWPDRQPHVPAADIRQRGELDQRAIAILFEVLVVTGFLIGVGVGFFFAAPLLVGLAFAGISVLGTGVATMFALNRGD